MYGLIRNLTSPEKPSDKSYAELKTLIAQHLKPKPLAIAERFLFYQRNQGKQETVSQYIAELRKLSEHCDFGEFLNQALRDRLVCGLSSLATQRKLLAEDKLELKRAVDIAISMELAENEARKLKADAQDAHGHETVHKVSVVKSKPCYRCGKTNHTPDKCFYKNSKCHTCQEMGHIHKMCSKKKSVQHKKQKKKSKLNFVTENQNCSDDDNENEHWPIFSLSGENRGVNAMKFSVTLEGIPIEMDLDTGASISVISEQLYHTHLQNKVTLCPSEAILKTYSGEPLGVLGEVKVNVKYQTQMKTLPVVVVKGNGPALFGRNWMEAIKLDWHSIHFMAGDLKKYSVFDNKLGCIKGVTASLKVKDDVEPKFFKPRPVPFALRDKISKELDRLEKTGILEKVECSDWAAPIVPAMKADGSVRICGDFKVTVNPYLDIPEYPFPTSEELFTKLNGGEKFSKRDLSQADNQVVLDKESRKYVTINTHQGLYRYTRLPFGIASAPAIFQRTMDTILQGLDKVGYILDDILVTGVNDGEHKQILETTLQRLDNYGVKLQKSKCQFMQDQVEYFGFIVSKEGIKPSPKKLEAIRNMEDPKSKKELQTWLGIVNYYRKFVPNMSTLSGPLTHLLAQDVTWTWTQECSEACAKIKDLLVSSQVMAHYNPHKPLELAVDASGYGLGAVISHTDGASEKPIAYASRTLTAAEKNYSQIEREALAIIFGVTKFHSYLYGRKFTLITDHKPSTTIFGPKKGIPVLTASRLQRWALQLTSYQFDIKYRATGKHQNADTLSRFPMNLMDDSRTQLDKETELIHKIQIQNLPVTADKVAAATKNDVVLSRVMEFTRSGWPSSQPDINLLPYFRVRSELTIEDGCLLRGIRVVIPEKYRQDVLEELHVAHPGMVRMKSLARLHVWWPGLDSDIETKVSQCGSCRMQLPNLPKAPANPWIWPSAPWKRVHIDFAGPFMQRMFLIIVDAYSKWMDVVMMNSTTSESTINALRYLFSSYGLPIEIVSDNGP
ncbi:uncharacterized protein K02A2.6-like [Saccostrea cucullata]|uniref:uncharacterized protein K02A2.6-like n=1 Tax=Saccostrea cuccullata TaxID=36930 RepID=UPI002ED2E931